MDFVQGTTYRPLEAPQSQPQGQTLSPEMAKMLVQGLKSFGGASAPAATGQFGAGGTPVVGAGKVGSLAGGGGGSGSSLAAAGPWAALAAAIVANESKQRGDGNRPEGPWAHAGEIATGKVLERDANRYLGDWGGKIAALGTPHGIYNYGQRAFKKLGGLF